MTPSILIDTHILLWILSQSRRLKEVPWLKEYSCWTLSPISFLEIKFLNEIGRIHLDLPKIISKMKRDPRFKIDDLSLEELCMTALDLSWTRDPFDRLLVAHSQIRKLPFGTCDQKIRENYSLVV